MTIYVGQSVVKKQGGMGLGAQAPLPPAQVEASFTQAPIDVVESDAGRKVLTHRHFGHPEEHPVTLRHRKASADPMHAEEDKLIDEYKDLYDKARKGECNPLEMKRIHELRGRLQEIQATRETDARRILGRDMLEAADAQGGTFSLKPRQAPAKPAAPKPSGDNLLTQTASARSGKTFKGEAMSEDDEATFYGDDVAEEGGVEKRTISWSLDKAVDAAIMASSTIMKAYRGEPPYPADEAEDDGTHGSMADPASGEVAHDIRHAKTTGPYSGQVTSGSVARKARPKGWTKGSSKDFWESVSEKGPHARCVEHVGGTVDDPHAFCAWAEHEATGHWPGERRGKATEEKAAGDYYLKPGEEPPPGANVQEGPRGGRFIPGDGGRLHPKDEQDLQSMKVQPQGEGPTGSPQGQAAGETPGRGEQNRPAAPATGDETAGARAGRPNFDDVWDEFKDARGDGWGWGDPRATAPGGGILSDEEEDAYFEEYVRDQYPEHAEALIADRDYAAGRDPNAVFEKIMDYVGTDPDAKQLLDRYAKLWDADARTGDLRDWHHEELASEMADWYAAKNPGIDRKIVDEGASNWAADVFDDLARSHGWDLEGGDDHPSLSPGERNPSMGRWSSDPVVVPSSANIYKGAAFVQRPVK